MRINLICPFEERGAVKALGARWDAALKTWYLIDPADLAPFARWLPLDVGHFLATAGDAPQAKAPPKASTPASNSQPLTNEGATHDTPDWTPQDIHPDDPPW
jgi:hypothetical protein